MNKKLVNKIIDEYLKIFPNEKERLIILREYLAHNDNFCDWNNVNGHLTAGGFIYSTYSKKFLVLYHKDLNMFLYPGGHCEQDHNSPLDTAKNEIIEETGITDFNNLALEKSGLVPIDIDTHIIPFNSRINMPQHYHFDFRYLFIVDKNVEVKIDKTEMSRYKWISLTELKHDKNYGNIVEKIKMLNVK